MAQHLKKIKPKVAAYRPVAAAQPVVPYPRAILSASPCSLSYAAIVGAHLKKVKPLLAFQAWQGEMCLELDFFYFWAQDVRMMKKDFLKGEKLFATDLDNQIRVACTKAGKSEITLHIGSYQVVVSGADRVTTKGKAVVCDVFLHNQGVPLFFISHKKENYSERGYGRPPSSEILHPLNRHTDPRFRKYPSQVRVWAEGKCGKSKILDPWGGSEIQGFYFNMPDDLKIKAVYGDKAVKGNNFGLEFVHCLVKGNVELVQQADGSFVMKGNVHVYPDVPTGEDEPIGVFHADKKQIFTFSDGTTLSGWMGIFPRVCFSKKSKTGKPSGRCKLSVEMPLEA